MTTFITNMHGQAMSSTAQIAQNMAARLAKELGIEELGYYFYDATHEPAAELSSRQDGILSAISGGDTVIMQEPMWMEMPWQRNLLNKINAYRQSHHVKLVIFVHDVAPMMFNNPARIPEWIDFYNQADVLILPTPQMKTELEKWGLKVDRIVYQYVWDAPMSDWFDGDSPYKKMINFAGSPEKFTFINDWQENVPLHVFADQPEGQNNPQVEYEGYVASQRLAERLHYDGGFGLLWESSPEWFEYMKVNTSFKFGTYLAAGLPVIVHRGVALADMVEKYHLGKVVDSLKEASDWVESITEDEYHKLAAHVYEFGRLNRSGMFTKRALTEAVFEARLDG